MQSRALYCWIWRCNLIGQYITIHLSWYILLVRSVFVQSQWMKSKVCLNKDYTDIQQSETQNESLPQILVNIKTFFFSFCESMQYHTK